MNDPVPHVTPEQAAARRKSVVRTAWVIGGIAVAIYVAFLLSGIFKA
jgi:hypothetical protein